MARCVVVLGGDIRDYGRIKSFLKDDDYFIFCDRGLVHREALGVKCALLVGDFDSISPPLDIETIVYPREKDDTDALCGIKEGIRRGFRNFLIIGAFGGRIDHELGNIYLLDYLDEKNIPGRILNENSYIEVVSTTPKTVMKGVKYFSLIAFSGPAGGVSIEGAKYNLVAQTIEPHFQYGISNEVEEERAVIRVDKGKLLLIVTLSE